MRNGVKKMSPIVYQDEDLLKVLYEFIHETWYSNIYSHNSLETGAMIMSYLHSCNGTNTKNAIKYHIYNMHKNEKIDLFCIY